VAVAFAHDQPDNARRIARLGVGVGLPAQQVTVASLTRALETVLSGDYAARAVAAGQGISRDSFRPRLLAAVESLVPAAIA
jgi:UDP:flavonoid glycosyltransferase YjiC (YdhE family)